MLTLAMLAAVLLSQSRAAAAAKPAEEVAGVTMEESATTAKVAETPAQRDARMAWWREAKFGLFIHWGVYAVPAGKYGEKTSYGEWIMNSAKIPVAEYKGFAKQFNPVKYDPAAWARLAKDAGMRYIVITSKHHDGFALFPSEASHWNIAEATPYKKDLLGPLVSAAKAEGLKIGFYYSQSQDWNNPGGAKSGFKEGEGWDDAHKGDYDAYLKNVAVPQVRELLTRYPIDILWWDTPMHMTPQRAAPLAALTKLRPGLITNNRLGGGYRGDTETPEQFVPVTGYKGDWETCMTMNGHWGYNALRQQLEILHRPHPQTRRHLREGWQLPPQRRPDCGRRISTGLRRAFARHRPMAAREWRGDLRHAAAAVCLSLMGLRDAQRRHGFTCTSSTGRRMANCACR